MVCGGRWRWNRKDKAFGETFRKKNAVGAVASAENKRTVVEYPKIRNDSFFILEEIFMKMQNI